ncbi:hypothetical protein B0H65DRAFT_565694 [Neurospora tetraspora]|uniref:Uncharacterized protein n=1 Tax=Neurospora tetraspora TaxID=94610 RepID=A0AAE0JRD0_9PEZI|nr:hypothetical protein B0H65DRAFT_565694 [Neurospora tetraspora]
MAPNFQKQIEALQHQIEHSSKAHISELGKIQSQAAMFQEEIESLRQQISFAQFCNFFASGPQLPEEDWYAIVPHLTTQKPSTSCELPLPTEFWEVSDTWGPERASYPSVASDGVLESCLGLYAVLKDSSRQDCDWRNMALLSVRQLMKEMLSRGIVYKGLISLIANMVIGLVETKKLQKDDPLLFAIWQVVACADEMLTNLLSSERRAFRDILTGAWSDISRSIMFHTQTEDHKDIRPFDLVLQASLKPGRIYYHTSKVGVVVNRDMDSNQRRYIVLDFDTRRLRVVEGERWDVKDTGTLVDVKLLGNDAGTGYCFEIDRQSWELLISDTLDG